MNWHLVSFTALPFGLAFLFDDEEESPLELELESLELELHAVAENSEHDEHEEFLKKKILEEKMTFHNDLF